MYQDHYLHDRFIYQDYYLRAILIYFITSIPRFMYQDLSSTKVDTKVIFPQNGMDVRGFLSGPSSHGLVYDLYSIVCHFGGASAGHYTCYSKHPLTSQWYYYNDESVTAQVPSESEYSSGYVLYYQRQGNLQLCYSYAISQCVLLRKVISTLYHLSDHVVEDPLQQFYKLT